MKKLIAVLFTVTAFTVNVFAQEPSMYGKEQAATQIQKNVKDGIQFKAGKAWMIKGDKTTALDKEVTLVNGAKVTPSGTVVMKDGVKTTLKEGDFIAMDGTLERAPSKKE